MNESSDDEKVRLEELERAFERVKQELEQARARERALIDALPDMLFWMDQNGEVLDFRVPDDYLVVPRDQVKGWRITQEPMSSVAGQGCLQAIRQCLADRTPQSFRYEVKLHGRVRQQEARFAWRGDNCVLMLARDLTSDARRAERNRASMADEHERILRSLKDFVWSVAVDAQGRWRYRYCSPVVQKVTGRPPEFYLEGAERFRSTVHPEDLPKLEAVVPELVKNAPCEAERLYRIHLPDGELRWMSDRVRAERVGDEVLLTGVVTDVTDARRVEERLREAQRLEELGALAGGIAHDFNNLLVGMLGGAELALELLPEGHPAREQLSTISDSASRAAELCRQMLAYAGKGGVSQATVDVVHLVEDMSQLLRASVTRDAELRIELPEEPACVRADATQLRQLLLNLVNNASDAVCGSSGGRVELAVSFLNVDATYLGQCEVRPNVPPGPCVLIRVKDDGEGMPEEVLQRMFEPFFTTKPDGHGLGLPAALGIVRSHQGALKVGSTPGQGSSIEVALPAVQAQSGAGAQPTSSRSTPRAAGQGGVLVIDDEDTVLMIAGAILESDGYEVVTASSGQEGLASYEKHRDQIAVVLLDMTMPGMSGPEVYRRLRELDPDVPIIVSSGYSEEDALGELTQQHEVTFLSKPYRAAQLRQAVADTLRG